MSEIQSTPSVSVIDILKLIYNQFIQFKAELEIEMGNNGDDHYYKLTCGDVVSKIKNMIDIQAYYPDIAKELVDNQIVVRDIFAELEIKIDTIDRKSYSVDCLKRNFNTLYHLFALNNRAIIQSDLSPVPFISIIDLIYGEFIRVGNLIKSGLLGPVDMFDGCFSDIKRKMETILNLNSNFKQYLTPNKINAATVYDICDTLIDVILQVKLTCQKNKTIVTYLTGLGENIANLRILTSSNKLD